MSDNSHSEFDDVNFGLGARKLESRIEQIDEVESLPRAGLANANATESASPGGFERRWQVDDSRLQRVQRQLILRKDLLKLCEYVFGVGECWDAELIVVHIAHALAVQTCCELRIDTGQQELSGDQ